MDYDEIINEVGKQFPDKIIPLLVLPIVKECMKESCKQILDETAGRFETNGNDPIYASVQDEILQLKEEL